MKIRLLLEGRIQNLGLTSDAEELLLSYAEGYDITSNDIYLLTKLFMDFPLVGIQRSSNILYLDMFTRDNTIVDLWHPIVKSAIGTKRLSTTKDFLKLYKQFVKKSIKQHGLDKDQLLKLVPPAISRLFDNFLEVYVIDQLIKILNRNPDIWRKFANKSFEEIEHLVEKFAFNPKQVVKAYPNKWFWYDLRTDYCTREKELMGHCGAGQHLFSLRDPSNQPHITIDYDTNSERYLQIFGKENSMPSEKYWDYIKDFVHLFPGDLDGNFTLSTYDDEDDDVFNFLTHVFPEDQLREMIGEINKQLVDQEIDSINDNLSFFHLELEGEEYDSDFYVYISGGHEIEFIAKPVDPEWFDDDLSRVTDKFLSEEMPYDYFEENWYDGFEKTIEYEGDVDDVGGVKIVLHLSVHARTSTIEHHIHDPNDLPALQSELKEFERAFEDLLPTFYAFLVEEKVVEARGESDS